MRLRRGERKSDMGPLSHKYVLHLFAWRSPLTETRNITLTLPKALLQRFKRFAVEKEKSVSALIRELMEETLRKDDAYERAHRAWLEDMKHPRDLGTHGKITWTRDELHERR